MIAGFLLGVLAAFGVIGVAEWVRRARDAEIVAEPMTSFYLDEPIKPVRKTTKRKAARKAVK